VNLLRKVTLSLTHILEVVTPVRVVLVTVPPVPLFRSFGTRLGSSSVRFLATYTPRARGESILSMESLFEDLSSSHRSLLSEGSFTFPVPLGTSVEANRPSGPRTNTDPNQVRIDCGRLEGTGMLAQSPEVPDERNPKIGSLRLWRISEEFLRRDVMTPGPWGLTQAENASDEVLGKDRKTSNRKERRMLTLVSLLAECNSGECLDNENRFIESL